MNSGQGQAGMQESFDLAIVGMAGRFPGARNVQEFWQNLREGKETISFFTEEELRDAGVPPELINDPQYVPARGILQDIEMFDAGFFGVYPREAETMDPQHRLFLECAWESLEDAGYCADTYPGSIGVFGGTGMSSYLFSFLSRNGAHIAPAEGYQLVIGNEKDFLATRVSYKMGLRGPSATIQTACSTSLVAVHTACQSLLNYQCDMALAGGVTISLPQKSGYMYQEGMILSPDGHCRAFDARANGTVGGNGVGVVVLKRLEDARADGDHMYAIIKGSACNNDGSQRVGFTSPGIDGQAEVIAMAQAVAGVEPDTIDYIETHGTGTPLGDPIEIAALTQVFRNKTNATSFCAIGSVKTNVGHLDAAAGVTGLMKAALALKHRQIPPSLHFEHPNPKTDIDRSPFYVNASLKEWTRSEHPRRAAVSSFGIGGTNAHVILEEAPLPEETESVRSSHLLLLSAKSAAALEQATTNLLDHLQSNPGENVADVACTLQAGRKAFNHRRMMVASSVHDAFTALASRDPRRVFTMSHPQEPAEKPIAFMFSGQGAQYVNMGLGLYRTEPVFRHCVDECAETLRPILGLDLRDVLYPSPSHVTDASGQLRQTQFTQPALFVIEYAMATLLMEWGMQPQAMIGHSIGEYAAACIAGVLSLPEALRLVAARGRLMQSMPEGGMLSVQADEEIVRRLLDSRLTLAALNAPGLTVVSGPLQAIGDFRLKLQSEGIESRALQTSHAFHSAMMDPILEPFEDECSRSDLQVPRIPFLSNLTGTWIRNEEAVDPRYWSNHLRFAVRFGDGVRELMKNKDIALLEVGPGQTLTMLARRQPEAAGRTILSTMRHPQEDRPDDECLLSAVGRLWLAGVQPSWQSYQRHHRARRISLPPYPFERRRYWIDGGRGRVATAPAERPGKRAVDEWFSVPSWKREDLPEGVSPPAGRNAWYILMDRHGLGNALLEQLHAKGENASAVDPESQSDLHEFATRVAAEPNRHVRIVHLREVESEKEAEDRRRERKGFESLLMLVKALTRNGRSVPVHLYVVTTQGSEVLGTERIVPEKAMISGLSAVVSGECALITCSCVDVAEPDGEEWAAMTANLLLREGLADDRDRVVAYRGNHRWVRTFNAVRFVPAVGVPPMLREGGVYLITGGLGRIGLLLASYLAETVKARMILLGRTQFPDRKEWEQALREHHGDGRTARTIQQLLSIEEKGGELFLVNADVADEHEMAEAVQRGYDRFGEIHGVIHAAGDLGEHAVRLLDAMTPADCASQFKAKVDGTYVLEKIFHGRKLDFCLLQSSLSSILGGIGFGAYAAANAFLDAFALRNRGEAARWLSVSWDAWNTDNAPLAGQPSGGRTVEQAITPAEGIEAFRRLFSLHCNSHVIVSTRSLMERLSQETLSDSAAAAPAANDEQTPSGLHDRPDLQTPYAAPGSDLEEQIVHVWQQLLGIGRIGMYDNFFDLGGNSLLGTQLISQLRNTFHVELPLRSLFEDPTVDGVAKIITAERSKKENALGTFTELLKKVEGLSDTEVREQLSEQAASQPDNQTR